MSNESDEDPFGFNQAFLSKKARLQSRNDAQNAEEKCWNEEEREMSGVPENQFDMPSPKHSTIIVPYPKQYLLDHYDDNDDYKCLEILPLTCLPFDNLCSLIGDGKNFDLLKVLILKGWTLHETAEKVLCVSGLEPIHGFVEGVLEQIVGQGAFGYVEKCSVGLEVFAVKTISFCNLPQAFIMETVVERESAMELLQTRKQRQCQTLIPLLLESVANDSKKKFRLNFAVLSWQHCRNLPRYESLININKIKNELENFGIDVNESLELEKLKRLIYNSSQIIRSTVAGDHGFEEEAIDALFCQLSTFHEIFHLKLHDDLQLWLEERSLSMNIAETLQDLIASDAEELSDYLRILNFPLAAWLEILKQSPNEIELKLLSVYFPNTLQDFIDDHNEPQVRNVEMVSERSEINECEEKERKSLIHWAKDSWYRKKVAELVFSLANALLELHNVGCIHRDIKPKNILGEYDENERNGIVRTSEIDGHIRYDYEPPIFSAHIADFSVARRITPLLSIQSAETYDYLTQSLGDMLYCAPEMQNRKNYNEKVDVYSLGVVYIELLIGHQSTEKLKLEYLLKKQIPKRFSFYYDCECEVIGNMLKEAPENRFSIKMVTSALSDMMGTLELPNIGERSFDDNAKNFPFWKKLQKPLFFEELYYRVIESNNIMVSDEQVSDALEAPFLENLWQQQLLHKAASRVKGIPMEETEKS